MSPNMGLKEQSALHSARIEPKKAFVSGDGLKDSTMRWAIGSSFRARVTRKSAEGGRRHYTDTSPPGSRAKFKVILYYRRRWRESRHPVVSSQLHRVLEGEDDDAG